MTTMQISVRSYLTAGTVAVVGAGAIALAPVAQNPSGLASALHSPVAVDVALSATTLSLSDILGLATNLSGLLPTNLSGLIPTNLSGLVPTDLSGLLSGLSGLIPSGLTNTVPANFVDAVVAEFVKEAGGLLGATGTEVLNTLTTAFTGLLSGPGSIPAQFGAALANIPAVLISSVGSLVTGNIPAALEALTTGLIAPFTAVTQTVVNAVQAFQAYVTGVAANLLTSLPGVLLTSIGTVLGVNLQSALSGVQGGLSGLLSGLSGLIPGLPKAAAIPASAAVAPAAAVVRAVGAVAAPVTEVAARRQSVAPAAAAASANSVAPQLESVPAAESPASAVSAAESVVPSGQSAAQQGLAEAGAAATEVTAVPRQALRARSAAKADHGRGATAEQAATG